MTDPMRDSGFDGLTDVPDDVYGHGENWPDADCGECGHHASLHYREQGQTGCGSAWCGCTGYTEEANHQ